MCERHTNHKGIQQERRFHAIAHQFREKLTFDFGHNHLAHPPTYFFRGKDNFENHYVWLLNISMMGFPGGKVLKIKKVLFSQMNICAFSKKIFGKIWLSYGNTQNFRGAKCFSKVFKNGFVGAQKWFDDLKYVWYYVTHIKMGAWVPLNVGMSQFKSGFLAMPNFCLWMAFSTT